mgnify:CR=1 FL=1
MSKTGAWIMDMEEKFWDKCVEFIKSNEDVTSAVADAVQYNKEHLYLNMDENEIEDAIHEMWNDYWVNYQ